MLPDAPRPSLDLKTSKSLDTPLLDGVIGYVSQTPAKASLKHKLVSNIGSNNPSKNLSSLGKSSEVHAIQSIVADKSSNGKKKGKGKAKADASK